ncbi:MAG: hypothetical protein ACREMH_09345 [Gemmatimonadales bacterium]
MSAQLDSRRGLRVAAVLLGLAALACTTTPGNVSAPEIDLPDLVGTRVEGVVRLTTGYSAQDLPVQMIWTEEGDDLLGHEGGILEAKEAVPVAPGEIPRGAQVRVARTDARGAFVHPSTITGGLTLRVGSLPDKCRPPADRVVYLDRGEIALVEIDVICSRPKPTPLP